MLTASLKGLLQRYAARWPDEKVMVDRFLAFVDSGEILQGKHNPRRHITASAWIVNSERTKVLLTHHAKLGIWVQLGGHTDAGEGWASAAMREAEEESGLECLALSSDDLFDLDIHTIPARSDTPAHEHYDIRFLLVADDREQPVVSHESHDVKWVALSDLERFTQEASQMRMRSKT